MGDLRARCDSGENVSILIMDLAPSRAVFATTSWSVVLAAGGAQSTAAREALETLAQSYWPPLYAFARRSGCSPDDARDLTQSFFARLLEKGWLADADAERGRFRAFLLTSFRRFMGNERNRDRAAKRGGGCDFFSIDAGREESRLDLDPPDFRTPELAFERHWATTLLERVLGRLQEEFAMQGRVEFFEGLKPFLLGDPPTGGYAQAASRLGMSEGAAKMSVTRLRQRYRQILRSEIAQTVTHAGDIDDELRYLRALLGP